jgi:hypothetical protein
LDFVKKLLKTSLDIDKNEAKMLKGNIYRTLLEWKNEEKVSIP